MQTAKINLKNFRTGGEWNPGLQIQSQLSLPLDQEFKKNA